MSLKSSQTEIPKMRAPDLSSMVDFQKMVFIYNAVNDGWTVHLLPDGRYEFNKANQTVTSDMCMDDYLQNFIRYYMQLKSTPKTNPKTTK